MKIGFDLDGCVIQQDLGILRVINTIAKGENYE